MISLPAWRLLTCLMIFSPAVLPMGARGAEQPATVSEALVQPENVKPPRSPQASVKDAVQVAKVNGWGIDRRQWLGTLIEAYGFEVLRELIGEELARQAAGRNGLHVTGEQIDREYDRMVRQICPEKDLHGRALTDRQRRRILHEVLRRRGVSAGLFKLSARRNAYLRAVAETKVEISDQMLQEQYALRYGPRVQVRHIQVPDLKLAEEIISRLQQGADFAELARRYSTNLHTAESGGLMPVFSRDDSSLPQLIREAAFSLEEGQVSSVLKVDGQYHILKLQRRIPADRRTYEQVRDQLRRDLREQLISRKMVELQNELFRDAQVEILDPALADRYKNWLKEFVSTQERALP